MPIFPFLFLCYSVLLNPGRSLQLTLPHEQQIEAYGKKNTLLISQTVCSLERFKQKGKKEQITHSTKSKSMRKMFHFKHTIILFRTQFSYLPIKEAKNSKFVWRGFWSKYHVFTWKTVLTNRSNSRTKLSFMLYQVSFIIHKAFNLSLFEEWTTMVFFKRGHGGFWLPIFFYC